MIGAKGALAKLGGWLLAGLGFFLVALMLKRQGKKEALAEMKVDQVEVEREAEQALKQQQEWSDQYEDTAYEKINDGDLSSLNDD